MPRLQVQVQDDDGRVILVLWETLPTSLVRLAALKADVDQAVRSHEQLRRAEQAGNVSG